MAFQTRDVVDAMRTDAGLPLTELKADGGASVMDVLLQFQADLLGVPVRRPVIQETTALGAGFLAGLELGVWGSTEEVATTWLADREFHPAHSEDTESAYRRWRQAVQRALGWAAPEG
jgi:glycerol kinase